MTLSSLPALDLGAAALLDTLDQQNRRRALPHLLGQLQKNEENRTIGMLGDLRLASHFQPIYSLSHSRVMGHEALLRATDAKGKPVPPPDVFNLCHTERELAWCDNLSRLVHVSNFVNATNAPQWLFLNVHPKIVQLLCREDGNNFMRSILDHFHLSPEHMVLEVLEGESGNSQVLEEAVGVVRSHGCLIAIDDFGAGHSNFDRVWRLRPDIVKLDRSLVARAAKDRGAQRVVSQMVSLLHECGAMVVMEGVETYEEALLAMESDADLVQGYYFSRPNKDLVPQGHAPETLKSLYTGLGERRQLQRQEHLEFIAPYRHAIGNAGVLLSSGRSFEIATRDFLALERAEMCYALDADGYQIGPVVRRAGRDAEPTRAYAPLMDSEGACWARRPYFRRAMEDLGKVHITRPYRTLQGPHTCMTASFAFHHLDENGKKSLRVICGDLVWSDA